MAKYIEGGAELARALRELPEEMAKKHLRKSVVRAARLVRNAARRSPAFNDRTGRLRRNIIIKFVREESNPQKVTYFVLVRSGKRFQRMRKGAPKGFVGPMNLVNNDAYYWRFVEFGTAKMSPRPFLRPAFENNKEAAVDAIVDQLKKGLDQSVNYLKFIKGAT